MLAALAMFASTMGAVQQTVSSYYSSAAEKTKLGLQADLDAINAKLADGAARDTMQRGEREYGNSRLRTAALKGRQRAELADAGFDLGFGSAAQILTSTDLVGEVDAETIKANAMREAWGHRLDATNLRGSSRVNKSAAKSINPTLNAAATLLTTGGQVASSYYSLKAAGAFDKPKGPSGATPSTGTKLKGPY